jgi:predicted O-methyltransferase YrrM
MPEDRWGALENYYANLLHAEDPVLDAALKASQEAGLRNIAVSESQGKMLMLLVMATGARRILEIGTLGGYSALWMARGLTMGPQHGGKIITLEKDPETAFVARRTVMDNGAEDLIEVRVGDAARTLRKMVDTDNAPFDLVFIDADRQNLPSYLVWALKLSRPGTMIIADNVVRRGQVADPDYSTPEVQGVRTFLDLAGQDSRLECTVIQTVGSKGHDGFCMCVVQGPE